MRLPDKFPDPKEIMAFVIESMDGNDDCFFLSLNLLLHIHANQVNSHANRIFRQEIIHRQL